MTFSRLLDVFCQISAGNTKVRQGKKTSFPVHVTTNVHCICHGTLGTALLPVCVLSRHVTVPVSGLEPPEPIITPDVRYFNFRGIRVNFLDQFYLQ